LYLLGGEVVSSIFNKIGTLARGECTFSASIFPLEKSIIEASGIAVPAQVSAPVFFVNLRTFKLVFIPDISGLVRGPVASTPPNALNV